MTKMGEGPGARGEGRGEGMFEVRRSRFEVGRGKKRGRVTRGKGQRTPGSKFHLLPLASSLVPRACRGAAGFTLLEMMLAMVILAIAFPVLLGLRNRDVELLGYADNVTTATLLAQEKLFETELMGFPPTGEQAGDFQNPAPGSLTSASRQDRERDAPGSRNFRNFRNFRWTRTVVSTPLEAVREVRIRIAWPRGAVEETVEVTSYVFLDPQRQS